EHPWPGNVRELRNWVESLAVLRSKHGELPRAPKPERGEEVCPEDEAMWSRPFKEAKQAVIERFEREYIGRLLKRHGGNVSKASLEAQIDRNTIHEFKKKYGLK